MSFIISKETTIAGKKYLTYAVCFTKMDRDNVSEHSIPVLSVPKEMVQRCKFTNCSVVDFIADNEKYSIELSSDNKALAIYNQEHQPCWFYVRGQGHDVLEGHNDLVGNTTKLPKSVVTISTETAQENGIRCFYGNPKGVVSLLKIQQTNPNVCIPECIVSCLQNIPAPEHNQQQH